MTIEQTIQKAQEGGYLPEHYLNLYPGGFVEVRAREDETPNMPDRSLPDIFIDPAFWQALGKGLGVIGYKRSGYTEMAEHTGKIEYHGLETWKALWHDFISALADGQSTEQFFNQF